MPQSISASESTAADSLARLVKSETLESVEEEMPSLSGMLHIHESGKMIMKFGEIEYDVSSGPVSQFAQSLVCLDKNTGDAYFLGNAEDRFICSPCFDSLYMQ